MSIRGGDTPTIASSLRAASAYQGLPAGRSQLFSGFTEVESESSALRFFKNTAHGRIEHTVEADNYIATTKEAPVARRIIQVYIADPNENVPLEDSILYSGDQKMTDLTDQELFFEIDIKSILEKHNEKRTKVVDKKVKDRTEYLEAAKVRDLKMVVVTVASF